MNKCKKTKKGMTLVDVIIAIGIFTVGVAGFTILFSRAWTANSFIIEEGQATLMASRAVDRVIREVREARQADNGDFMISSGDDFNLTVYIDDDEDGVTERVHYFLESEQVKKGVTDPSGTPISYPPGDESVVVISNYVMNSPSEPIFYYYNENYPGDIINNPLSTPVDVGDIKLIKVSFLVNIKPDIAPENVWMESFVNLRNLNEFNE